MPAPDKTLPALFPRLRTACRTRPTWRFALTVLLLAAAASCAKKSAPSCERLKSCCDELQKDRGAFAATGAVKTCETFLSVYPKDPSTGEAPGEDFCASVASDLPAALAKGSKPAPASCQ